MTFFKDYNNIEILILENSHLKVEIVPALGGKIKSIYNKNLHKEFLWHNKDLPLQPNEAGADYDSNFWGGIDELIPNDIPEVIDSISYPDHGELWTTVLSHRYDDGQLSVFGTLKLSELYYEKTMILSSVSPTIIFTYKIRNESTTTKNFLWKLHAALIINEGDRLSSSARKAEVVYPESSRFKTKAFNWPNIEGQDVSVVPPKNSTMDFFYLHDVPQGSMKLTTGQKHAFTYGYDKKMFPFQWYFASYGGFLNHYTAILEPASSMPVSVNEAKKLGQCSVLKPGEEITTTVTIYAGENY